MEISNIITFFIVLILILFIFVVMINFIIPFKFKSDFDDISSSYHNLVQLEGGMDDDIRLEFENELLNLGMDEIVIDCKSVDEVRYGEKFVLYVSAIMEVKTPNKYLIFEKKKEKLEFRRVSFSKKLVN